MSYDFYYEAKDAIRALNQADWEIADLNSRNAHLVDAYNDLVRRFNHNVKLIREMEVEDARIRQEALNLLDQLMESNERGAHLAGLVRRVGICMTTRPRS